MRLLGFDRRTLSGLVVALSAACGDDIPNADGDAGTQTDGSSSGATSSSPTTNATTSPATTAMDTTGDPDGSGTTTATDTGATLRVDTEVITYPQQPMVVDVSFSVPDLTVTANVSNDPGALVETIAGEADETRVRLRGLAPATLHSLAWSVEDGTGATADGETDVQTEAPLPGFVASFPVQGDATGLGGYLLFDVVELGMPALSSLFAVDDQGVTRWHYGLENGVIDPSIVYAAAQLRPDGTTMFLRDYAIVAIDELGEETFRLDSATIGVPGLHHDFVELPNGNFLTMTYTFADINDPGPGTTYIAGDMLLEVTPDGTIVWEWDMFDHLDVDRRPPGFDELVIHPETGEAAQDWTHSNGLLYEEATDTVLVSIRHQDWLVRIDRATDQIVWRFGFEGDFTLTQGTWQWHQHSPQWQPDGSLLLYDNGLHNPDVPDDMESSRAVRYTIDEMAMTAAQVWEDEEEDFLVPIAGDADLLGDGTYLITDSSIDFGILMPYAQIRKVDEASPADPQWTLLTEVGTFVYRCIVAPRLVGVAR